MLACMFGRNVVLVELEEKFCKMMCDNWELVKMKPQLGCQMGTCQIIQGDARNLEGLLADKIITSPPYAEQPLPSRTDYGILGHPEGCKCNFCRKNRGNKGAIQGYRQADKIITSPPFGEATQKLPKNYHIPITGSPLSKGTDEVKLARYSDNPDNLGNLPYGD
ncbi:unnamed protein product, partial [marine sediment metagenome]